MGKKSLVMFSLICVLCVVSSYLTGVYATSPSSATVCNDQKPECKPDLFQVDAGANFAKLYINPCKENCSKAQILYGRTESADEYSVDLISPTKDGVFTSTINSLDLNTKYFFKIRCVNGCSNGDASNVLSAQTSDCVTSYYTVGTPQKGVCGTGGSETQVVPTKATGKVLGTSTTGGLATAGNTSVWLTALVGSAIIAFIVTLKTSSFSVGFKSRRKRM